MLGLLGGLASGLGGIFGGSSTSHAAGQNKKLLDKLLKEGTSYIDTSSGEAKDYLGQVGDIWSGLTDASGGLSGLNMYANALGLNGAEGNAAAQGAFQTSPGYQFQLDSGLDALSRSAAAQGRLSSGQTGLDTLGYAQGLANSEYNNWLSNLSGYGNTQAGLYTTGLTGQAGSLSDLANLATNTGNQRLNLLSEVTNGKMGANNQNAQGQQQSIQGGLSGFGSALGSLFGGYL